MRQIAPSLVLYLSCCAVHAAPQFDDFPATKVGTWRSDVQLIDAKSRRFGSILRSAARRDVNFAGHYILASWGCGTSCVMAAVIDTKTGSVTWLPFTVCCWNIQITEPLEFRPESRLLIVHGSRDEKGAGDDLHFYEFQGNKFRMLLGK